MIRSTHRRPVVGLHERIFFRLDFSVVDLNGPAKTIESRNLFFFRSYESAAGSVLTNASSMNPARNTWSPSSR